jgi:hypothetical protein
LSEFTDYKQDLILTASLQVAAPLGQYDSSKIVNIMTNHWSVKPELGMSKAFGPLTFDLAVGVAFYTANGDFSDGHTREQAPLYSLQGHLIYNLGRGVWGAVDGTYYTGGRTTIDDVEGEDLQKNSRVGITLSLPVNKYNSIKLPASTGVSTRTGSNFDALRIAWQYCWGGGL